MSFFNLKLQVFFLAQGYFLLVFVWLLLFFSSSLYYQIIACKVDSDLSFIVLSFTSCLPFFKKILEQELVQSRCSVNTCFVISVVLEILPLIFEVTNSGLTIIIERGFLIIVLFSSPP